MSILPRELHSCGEVPFMPKSYWWGVRGGACVYGVGACVYGVGACFYDVGACVYGVGACVYGLGACVYGVGACVYGVGACVYSDPMILVSAQVPLGLIWFLNFLGLGWGRVWGVWD